MSIMRPVVRQCAVAAMRGRTWCSDRVYDSDNTPLADALIKQGEGSHPYCVVYTDDDNRLDGRGTDIFRCIRRQMTLVLEIGVAGAVEGKAGNTTIRFPHTDAAMEFILDVVEGQALRALYGDPQSAWGELLRRMTNNVDKIMDKRGGRATGGVRWAARQIQLTVETIADPPAGVPLLVGHPVRDFIELAKRRPEDGIETVATMIERLLDTNETYPSWEQDQAWLGLTKYGLRAIGIAPVTREHYHWPDQYGVDILREDREAPDLHSLTVEGGVVVWGDEYDINTDPHAPSSDTLYRLLAAPLTVADPKFTGPRARNAHPLLPVNLIIDRPAIGAGAL